MKQEYRLSKDLPSSGDFLSPARSIAMHLALIPLEKIVCHARADLHAWHRRAGPDGPGFAHTEAESDRFPKAREEEKLPAENGSDPPGVPPQPRPPFSLTPTKASHHAS